MSLSSISDKAKKIKAVVLDGDGVLFTGRVFVDGQDEKLKERSHIDGQGISLLRSSGILVAFVSAEASGFVEATGQKLNNLPSVKNGQWPPVGVFTGFISNQKIEVIEKWLKENNIDWSDCAYMGDDIGDYKIIQKVGFGAAPAQAEDIIKDICQFVAKRNGGDGAIRDLVNFILEAKNIDITTLALR